MKTIFHYKYLLTVHFCRLFILAFILELGVFYTLAADANYEAQYAITSIKDTRFHSIRANDLLQGFKAMEVLEKDEQNDKVEDDENQFIHYSFLNNTQDSENSVEEIFRFTTVLYKHSKCFSTLPLFVFFHTWKFHFLYI